MKKFLDSVASVLEVESIGIDDDFRAVPDWCSLQGFGLLVLMENDWKTPLTVDRFLELKTVRDLYREAFLSFAAGIFGVSREILNANMARGDIPEWDSVNHLRLAMEAETYFGAEYPLERIPLLNTMEDFIKC